ncbi:hypothetical protein [Kutzneria kofuensis]|uniref:WD40 repeat domain-containing protein n=1 Tax=Kutzneria kofuensis TaxID=103725 RepID=UPI0031EB804F
MRLTALGDGTPDTRRRVSRAELDADETMDAVLDALTDARLITVDRDGVEVTHEALISHWPRLRDWLAADREGLRTHRQLTDATEAWAAVDEDPGALYRGTRLELARDWVDRADPVLTERERRFYDASVAARTREETAGRRRTTRLRLVVALLAVLVLAATAGIVRSVAAEHDADQQRDIAVAQDAARQAATLRGSNPALSLQLSLAAYRLANVPVTRDGLLSSFAQPYSTRVDAGPDVSFQAAVSPKRHLMALSSRVGASIWDIADPHRPRQVFFVPGHTQTLLALAFNPEGTLLASVSTDRSTKLWDVTDPAHIRLDATMEGHAGVVDAVAFAPDGRTLLTGSYDGTARLWDVTEPAQPRPAGTIPAPGGALAVGFAPSGDFIAVAGAGVRLWDPHDLSAPLGVVDDNSAALAFTPDSRRLAVAAPGNQIMLLDVGNPRQPRTESTTPGPDSGVSSLAVSADGTLLAAGSGDHNVRLWDISDAAHPVTRATLPDYDSAVPAGRVHPGRLGAGRADPGPHRDDHRRGAAADPGPAERGHRRVRTGQHRRHRGQVRGGHGAGPRHRQGVGLRPRQRAAERRPRWHRHQRRRPTAGRQPRQRRTCPCGTSAIRAGRVNCRRCPRRSASCTRWCSAPTTAARLHRAGRRAHLGHPRPGARGRRAAHLRRRSGPVDHPPGDRPRLQPGQPARGPRPGRRQSAPVGHRRRRAARELSSMTGTGT